MSNSVEAVPLVARKQSGVFSTLASWQGLILLVLLAWLYSEILGRLFGQWRNDPNFSHGFFVPLFSLFVLWKNREQLKRIAPVPSWSGLSLIVAGLLTLLLGVFGAEIFLSRVSLLFVVAGMIVLFHGWPLFRAVLFPWAFLFLMIPVPVIVFQKITFPLQLLASKIATTALQVLQVPVHREGNVIELAVMKLEVVAACSGIRSLLSLLTLSIIYGYLMEERQWVRVVLAVSSIPIAVAANSLRIVGTGMLVQYWDPEKAEGFFHTFEGWLIFVVALTMLFVLHAVIGRVWKAPGREQPEVRRA
jgi:exosortase